MECIDAVPALIDHHAESPYKSLISDFNAQLPRTNVLTCNWYTSKGCNYNSRILPDFITGNDFKGLVSVTYTYYW